MAILKEFKEFAMKGNIMDLAVALIIGAAFGKIITALVDNVLMPIIGSFIGKSFSDLTAVVNGVVVKYGLFIQAVIDFLIVALVVFMIIRTLNNMKKKKEVVITTPEMSSTDKLLVEIRDSLKNRP